VRCEDFLVNRQTMHAETALAELSLLKFLCSLMLYIFYNHRSLFLVDQLRREGKLAPAGALATPLGSTTTPLHPPPDPVLELSTTSPTENGCRASIPQLAFGLYNIPNTDEGEQIIEHAIAAGYRHFDGASIYGNEVVLGRALRKSGIPRKDFFITSKVWNDAVKAGRDAVRKSVEKSLADVDFGGYFDLFLVHWPVSDHFVEAYQVLEEMHEEKLLHHIGLSNFDVDDYEELVRHGLSVPPVCNQFEVSPVMYRPNLVRYFQDKGIIVCASKGLGRGGEAFSSEPVQELARKHSATPAQIFLRWGLQKNLVVASKTSMQNRLLENRSILHFTLSESDINVLDDITTEADIKARNELEKVRKSSL
jgi:diketogulonate reductase-like aldo/keto reductase